MKDLRADNIQGLFTTLLSKKSASTRGRGAHEQEAKSLSPRVCRYAYIIIHAALDQALKNGLVVRNVADAATVPKHTKKEIRVLTVEEQARFTETVKGHRLSTAFILALGTELRFGELLALRWGDIDLNSGGLKVNRNVQRMRVEEAEQKTAIVYGSPKTEKGRRSIPLISEIVDMLKSHKVK